MGSVFKGVAPLSGNQEGRIHYELNVAAYLHLLSHKCCHNTSSHASTFQYEETAPSWDNMRGEVIYAKILNPISIGKAFNGSNGDFDLAIVSWLDSSCGHTVVPASKPFDS